MLRVSLPSSLIINPMAVRGFGWSRFYLYHDGCSEHGFIWKEQTGDSSQPGTEWGMGIRIVRLEFIR